ncbi:ACT domain-containing protein [Parendozoicomonas haliclonae]|uniref:Acetolactate synthase 2 regulatory subunit n=1 Tax=Parendozoicomonas haliclonae TaxID=1960125 RepID=A0A1X7AHW1_9GAMM|nr:ACT domain-containing protein [Parendozoicomonas haliclonae]SMA42249.1 acetolactate synthase 2 regulatory subunit [Parendozoicomonas haliclonae]
MSQPIRQYRLKLIAANTPGSLERVLNNSRSGGFAVDNFSASLCVERNQYLIDLQVSGGNSQNNLIIALLQESDIRSLTPYRKGMSAYL